MSKVKTIKVQNLKAVGAFEGNFNGCTALITGGNRKGKSSILRALPDRFRKIKPEVIVKQNETEGFAEWELTDGIKLIWSFDNITKKGERLTIITKDVAGNELKGSITDDIMKRYFPEIFDVDAFLQASPAKQRKALQELSNLDFTAIDSRYTTAFDDRAFKNKKVVEAEAKLARVDNTLPKETSSSEELQKELNLIDNHNEKFNRVKNDVQAREIKLPKIKLEIKRLQQLLKAAEEEEKQLNKEIKDGNEWLQVDKNKPKDEAYTDDLNKQIFAIQNKNALINQNNQAIKGRESFNALKDEAKNADNLVKAIINEKDEMIAGAKLPEGFGFTDDGITYNGMPFTKQSLASSEIYIAALKLASLTLGEVKMLHFDASFLDKNSLVDIERWAEANDLQLLIERPDYEGGEIKYELITDIAD
jgi:hypothetical protein